MKPEKMHQQAWDLFCKYILEGAERPAAAATHKLQATCIFVVSYFKLVGSTI